MEEILRSLRAYKQNGKFDVKDENGVVHSPFKIRDITEIDGIEGNYVSSTPADNDGNYSLIYKSENGYIVICNNINLF